MLFKVSRPTPPTLTLQNSNNAHALMEHNWQHDLLNIADDADAYHSDSSPPTSKDNEVSDDNALAQSPSPQIPGRFSTGSVPALPQGTQSSPEPQPIPQPASSVVPPQPNVTAQPQVNTQPAPVQVQQPAVQAALPLPPA
ncbi:hypothetical protein DXG01_012277, partial [Tephrocybe rancida]